MVRLQMSVQEELDEKGFTTDGTRERLVVCGHMGRQFSVRCETLATEQTPDTNGDAAEQRSLSHFH